MFASPEHHTPPVPVWFDNTTPRDLISTTTSAEIFTQHGLSDSGYNSAPKSSRNDLNERIGEMDAEDTSELNTVSDFDSIKSRERLQHVCYSI